MAILKDKNKQKLNQETKDKPYISKDLLTVDIGNGPIKWGSFIDLGQPVLRKCPSCLNGDQIASYAVAGKCGKCGFNMVEFLENN